MPSNEVRSPCKLCSQWEQPGLSEQSWDIDSNRQDNSAFTLNIFLLTNARISGFEEKHIFLLLYPTPNTHLRALQCHVRYWHRSQCSNHGKRSHSPYQANLCHYCRRLWCPWPPWDLTSLAGIICTISKEIKQLQVANVFESVLTQTIAAQRNGQQFHHVKGTCQFCSKQHLLIERKDMISTWLWKHLLDEGWRMHRCCQRPSYGEYRMYFSQERLSNLPLASSQIQITRKCIKERINQIEQLCNNQKKEWHLPRLPWVVIITSCTTVACAT